MNRSRILFLTLIILQIAVPISVVAQSNQPGTQSFWSKWTSETELVYNNIIESGAAEILTQRDKNVFYDIRSNRIRNHCRERLDSLLKTDSVNAVLIIEEFSLTVYEHRMEERYFKWNKSNADVYFNDEKAMHPYLDIEGWPHRSLNSIRKHVDEQLNLDYLLPYKYIRGKVVSWDSYKYQPENYHNFEMYKPSEYRIESFFEKKTNGELNIRVCFIMPSDDEKKTITIDISQY